MLALAVEPGLPVSFSPIRESAEIDPLLRDGRADAFLGMTYIGAKKQILGSVPGLRLISVNTWRGFFEVVPQEIRSFRDLRGHRVIISGPMGAGRNGGGDIIFRAAARRVKLDPDRDMRIEYMPAKDGMARVAAGTASGIAIPSPGSTGLVMRSRMGGASGGIALAALDVQDMFTGFPAFPAGQLPLGGLHTTERVLEEPARRAALVQVLSAYKRACDSLMREPERHAPTATELYTQHFMAISGTAPPAMLLARSIRAGDLVYRTDLVTNTIRKDLTAFLGELVGSTVDETWMTDL